jgi:prepilin-type N-terminal cleavage/methylation domain-containing protein
MPTHRPTSLRPGLTLVELLLSLAMLSILALAIASFVFALSTAWRKSDQLAALQSAGNQLVSHLSNTLAVTRYAAVVGPSINDDGTGGQVHRGSTLLLWSHDALSPGGGKPQAGEFVMLDHDASARTLTRHTPIPFGTLGSAAQATALLEVVGEDIVRGDLATLIRSGGIAQSNLMLGRTAASAAAATTAVESAEFVLHYDRAGRCRRIAYTLVLSRGGEQRSVSGSVALRVPVARPN